MAGLARFGFIVAHSLAIPAVEACSECGDRG
jgi:hypothetical protein